MIRCHRPFVFVQAGLAALPLFLKQVEEDHLAWVLGNEHFVSI
jgi:hypothetical protein